MTETAAKESILVYQWMEIRTGGKLRGTMFPNPWRWRNQDGSTGVCAFAQFNPLPGESVAHTREWKREKAWRKARNKAEAYAQKLFDEWFAEGRFG